MNLTGVSLDPAEVLMVEMQTCWRREEREVTLRQSYCRMDIEGVKYSGEYREGPRF